MAEEGTALQQAASSAAASLTGDAPAGDNQTDTTTASSHTPNPADEATSHIEWLKANADSIPAEKVAFLDKKFQPEFNRRLNLFNTQKSSVAQNAEAMLQRAGATLPEGKTVQDLLYADDGGKAFLDVLGKAVGAQVEPIKQYIDAAQRDTQLRGMIDLAANTFPEVKENLKEVLGSIDSDPDLTALSMSGGGKGLPYVMRGVALDIELKKAKAELHKVKEGVKVAAKVGTSSTKVSGGAVQDNNQPKPKGLRGAAKAAYAQLKGEAD